MRIRVPMCIGRFAAFSGHMWLLALPAVAAAGTLPWSFVNGSAKGYSIHLLQDDNDKSLSAGNPQQSQTVPRGDGTLTLEQSFVVPADVNEVRLFIPLVPDGLTHTDGELVLRYPVSP